MIQAGEVAFAFLGVVLFAAVLFQPATAASQKGGLTMEIKSSAFPNGANIPRKYACDGADLSPPLSWANPPPDSKSFALIADDPDAPGGTWVHWVMYDIPSTVAELSEGVKANEILPNNGAKQGSNDFRRVGYGGPCPPPGPPHRYFFKLYALDFETKLKPRATKEQLLKAMKGHILAEAQLMGRYQR